VEFYIIIFFLILILLILLYVYDVNIKKFKDFVKKEEEKLNLLTGKYPANIEICKYILNKLKNNSVKVEEDKQSATCLYIVATNKIIIANVRNSYTRIQTIAHECLHSIQPKKVLLFNFIYSNIYILYFAITTILIALKIIPANQIFLIIMLILSYLQYFIRSYLENDAMIKAKYLAKEYMEDLSLSSKEEIEQIVESYDKLNNIGIKMTNYDLFFKTIVKIFIVVFVLHIYGGI